VDHGLLREGEREEVVRALRPLGVNLLVVEAQKRFLSALRGVTDPEEKRKIIGREFIRVFEEVAKDRGPFPYLAQGTGLPKTLGFKLIEPFRELFKDEVREVAKLLGLPDEIRLRHPFPGPGLAVRILGEITEERLRVLRRADAIFIRALREAGLYREVWLRWPVASPARYPRWAGWSTT